MAIKEIYNFRQKYPQYNDIDDATLVQKLADKYPQYRDLPEKLAMETEERPSFRTEVLGPITQATSLFAADVPKAIASRDLSPAGKETFKIMYPEQKTFGGKALRFGLSVPAFAVGTSEKAFLGAGKLLKASAERFGKTVPDFIGKNLAGRTLLRTGQFSAAQAAIAPKEDEDYASQVGTAAIFGVSTPMAGLLVKGTGKNLVKLGKFTAKHFGGITDFSREKIKELGVKRVFDPIKAQADYIGKVIVPKVRERLALMISDPASSFTERLKGVLPTEDIKKLRQMSAPIKSQLLTILSGEPLNISSGINNLRASVGKSWDRLVSKQNPYSPINVSGFYNSLKRNLIKEGIVNPDGSLKTLPKDYDKTRQSLVSLYEYMNTNYRSRGMVATINDLKMLKNSLNSAYDDKSSYRFLIPKILPSINNAAEKAIPGLQNINKLYADTMSLSEMEGGGLFSKLLNPERLESELVKLKNIDRPNQIKRIQELIGKNLTDDVNAHLVNADLGLTSSRPGTGGGMFLGPSGVKRATLAVGTKKYYRDIYPITQKIGKIYEKFRGGAEGIYQRPLFGNPIFKSAPNIQGEGGFAQLGKQGIVEPSATESLKAEAQKGVGKSFGMAGLATTGLVSQSQAGQKNNKTLGQRNNNPINLKALEKWEGQVGKDEQGHVIFKDLDYGIRGSLKNLKTHQRKNPNESIAEYMNKFAEGNQKEEAEYIAKNLHVGTDTKLKDIEMERLLIYLAWFESNTKIKFEDIYRVKKKFKF